MSEPRVQRLMADIQEWEHMYRRLYKEEPSQRDRLQYMIGRVHGMLEAWRRAELESTEAAHG